MYKRLPAFTKFYKYSFKKAALICGAFIFPTCVWHYTQKGGARGGPKAYHIKNMNKYHKQKGNYKYTTVSRYKYIKMIILQGGGIFSF